MVLVNNNETAATTTTTTTTTTARCSQTTPLLSRVIESQLESLDDTDCYASAWTLALQKYSTTNTPHNNNKKHDHDYRIVQWGGRGKGGRGLARRTFQPIDVVVPDVRLEYVGTTAATIEGSDGSNSTATFPPSLSSSIECGVVGGGSCTNMSCRLLLEHANLKLLTARGKCYALIGRNGCGKSTLLRRIQAGKIPGFPPHVQSLYVPQEVFVAIDRTKTPIEWLLQQYALFSKDSSRVAQRELQRLEEEMEALECLDTTATTTTTSEVIRQIEELSEQMAELEDDLEQQKQQQDDGESTRTAAAAAAQEALEFMGLYDDVWNVPISSLSAGQCKKVSLAVTILCPTDLLLLDEPTNHLDVHGLLQLRRLLQLLTARTETSGPRADVGLETSKGSTTQPQPQQRRPTTVMLVSHDVDLINDVATDVIEFTPGTRATLNYYTGNYNAYLRYKRQADLHALRQTVALEKKTQHMVSTLQNLKQQAIPKKGGFKKKARQIQSHKKRMEREIGTSMPVVLKNASSSSSLATKAGVVSESSAATVPRPGMSTKEFLERTERYQPMPPDKAVQFLFRQPTSTWGSDEPVVMAYDVGHGYPGIGENRSQTRDSGGDVTNVSGMIVKKEGYLFDCVDLCLEEGGAYCIWGANASGKSTLLRILAKLESPLEGTVRHAHELTVGFLNEQLVEEMIETGLVDGAANAIQFLCRHYPSKTEKEIRGELTAFGLSPLQAVSNLRFLSGGERCRLCLAKVMLQQPEILFLDQPTANLDVESVDALAYGLNQWNGTVVMVTHDANFVRSIDNVQCYVLVEQVGKVMRVEGGMDAYLKSFGATAPY